MKKISLSLAHVWPEYAKRPNYNRTMRGSKRIVGYRPLWANLKANDLLPQTIRHKIFMKVHAMASHGDLSAKNTSWERADHYWAQKMPKWPAFQRDDY